jgi:hypothetical protein
VLAFHPTIAGSRVGGTEVSANPQNARFHIPLQGHLALPAVAQRSPRPTRDGGAASCEKVRTAFGNPGSFLSTRPGGPQAGPAASFPFQTPYASFRRNVL